MKPRTLVLAMIGAIGVVAAGTLATPVGETASAVEQQYLRYQRDFPELPDLSSDSLAVLLADSLVVLVDVRSAEEREVSIIPGSVALPDFVPAPGQQIVAYCTIGYRSGKYAERLRAQGFDAFNLRAGILGWVHAGRAVTHLGQPTHRVHVYGSQWNLLPEDYEPVY